MRSILAFIFAVSTPVALEAYPSYRECSKTVQGLLALPLVRTLPDILFGRTNIGEGRLLEEGLTEPQLLTDPLLPLEGRFPLRLEEDVLRRVSVVWKTRSWGHGKGESRPLLVELEDGTKGVWKSSRAPYAGYRAEVLAYELSELLGLDLVPPTVVRELGGEVGSFQLFVEPHPKDSSSERF